MAEPDNAAQSAWNPDPTRYSGEYNANHQRSGSGSSSGKPGLGNLYLLAAIVAVIIILSVLVSIRPGSRATSSTSSATTSVPSYYNYTNSSASGTGSSTQPLPMGSLLTKTQAISIFSPQILGNVSYSTNSMPGYSTNATELGQYLPLEPAISNYSKMTLFTKDVNGKVHVLMTEGLLDLLNYTDINSTVFSTCQSIIESDVYGTSSIIYGSPATLTSSSNETGVYDGMQYNYSMASGPNVGYGFNNTVMVLCGFRNDTAAFVLAQINAPPEPFHFSINKETLLQYLSQDMG